MATISILGSQATKNNSSLKSLKEILKSDELGLATALGVGKPTLGNDLMVVEIYNENQTLKQSAQMKPVDTQVDVDLTAVVNAAAEGDNGSTPTKAAYNVSPDNFGPGSKIVYRSYGEVNDASMTLGSTWKDELIGSGYAVVEIPFEVLA